MRLPCKKTTRGKSPSGFQRLSAPATSCAGHRKVLLVDLKGGWGSVQVGLWTKLASPFWRVPLVRSPIWRDSYLGVQAEGVTKRKKTSRVTVAASRANGGSFRCENFNGNLHAARQENSTCAPENSTFAPFGAVPESDLKSERFV